MGYWTIHIVSHYNTAKVKLVYPEKFILTCIQTIPTTGSTDK